MNLNLTLISLQIRHLSKSPLLTSISRLNIQNSKFKNIFSPISFNSNNLLISKTVFLDSLSSAIKTSITMKGTFYHVISLNYQDNVHIEIKESTFSNFKESAIYAYTIPTVEGELYLNTLLFQKCVSPQEGGCLSTTFYKNYIYKCCADSCQSAVRGHFLAATERINVELKNTFIIRCPNSASSSSSILIQSSEDSTSVLTVEASTNNISYCKVINNGEESNLPSVATIEAVKIQLSMYDIVFYCNSGSSILSTRSSSAFIITSSYFYGNTNHDNGVINIYSDHLNTIYIEGKFSQNGTPTFVVDIEDESYPSIVCSIDAPPVNEFEQYFANNFNQSTILPYTFIDIKPNSQCYIPDEYQRPKQVTIVISVCASIIGAICIISIIGISFDVKKLFDKKHFKYDTVTDQLNAIIV